MAHYFIPSVRKAFIFLVVAGLAAFFIARSHPPLTYDQQLIRLQAKEILEPVAPNLLNESLEIQTYLLDYSRDPNYNKDQSLFLKTTVALSAYPQQTRNLLQLYGLEPEFKDVISRYGEIVVPVVTYFLDHDVLTLRITQAVGQAIQNIKNFWGPRLGIQVDQSSNSDQSVSDPRVRGLYAITFIKNEGHSFLGQFDLDPRTSEARWNGTNRAVTGLGSFFTSGVATINRKYNIGEQITGEDIFFAATDIIPLVVAAKLAKAGKLAAASTKEVSYVARTRIYGSKLIPRTSFFRSLGKYGATAATIYVAATNPSLISSALEELGKLLNIDPTLAKIAGWTLLIAVLLYPVSGLLMMMAKVLLTVLTWASRSSKTRANSSRASLVTASS